MLKDAIAAYAHYAAIFFLAIVLGCETVLYRRTIPAVFVRALQRIDLGYLFAAVAIILTGIGRVFASPKGWTFYRDNPVFWTKMTLFAVLGVLSIVPTMHFLRWNRSRAVDGSVEVDARSYALVRAVLIAELAVLFTIPLCAALMSRGIGLR